jgi:hypothetical protein
MDFEDLPPGTIVTELSVGAGISGCNTSKDVLVSSQNCRFSTEAAIVFDSSCTATPTSVCEGYDLDTGTPHEDFGGPGIGSGGCDGCPFPNDEALGNTLMLAKDKVDNFDNGTGAAGADGLVDDPDDADCNGFFDFDFTDIHPKGVTLDRVIMQDIEFDEGEDPAEIFFTTSTGGTPPSIAINDTGNGGKVDIDLLGTENVISMRVTFKGSGALGALFFNEPELRRACWATYGGFNNAFIGPEGSKVASFGGNVGPPPSGHLNVVHHELGQHLKVPDVEVVSCERIEANCPNSGGPGQPGGKKGFDVNTLNFAGTGTLDGVEVDVEGKIIDCGEPQGKKGVDPDQFWIYTDGGLFVGGPHDGGNAQLHPPVGKP